MRKSIFGVFVMQKNVRAQKDDTGEKESAKKRYFININDNKDSRHKT